MAERRALSRESGQAQLELLAGLPLLLLACLVALQLVAVAYGQSLADGAAEAGAIAVADGRSPERAARDALPGWAASRVDVDAGGGEVEVELRVPAVLPGLPDRAAARALGVSSQAYARPAGGGS